MKRLGPLITRLRFEAGWWKLRRFAWNIRFRLTCMLVPRGCVVVQSELFDQLFNAALKWEQMESTRNRVMGRIFGKEPDDGGL